MPRGATCSNVANSCRLSEPMNRDSQREAMDLAWEIADRLVAGGAAAVVLMGSVARGDDGAHSDLDLLAIGDGPAYQLELHRTRLTAISWATICSIETSFVQPDTAGYAVQGWRDGKIIHDEQGIAARLQVRARAWDWSDVGNRACDRYVAREICGLAEEVQKLVGLLQSGNLTGAAVQRNILACRIGAIMAVHLRLLYSTENELWNLVNQRLGAEWAAAQSRAFGLRDEKFEETCGGALALYQIAAMLVTPLFDAREREVIDHACENARIITGSQRA